MSIEERSIENLKEYVKADAIYNGKVESDFDKFCYNHCKDIDIVLNYVKVLSKRINDLEKINEEHQKINGELREELKKIENQKQAVLDFIAED